MIEMRKQFAYGFLALMIIFMMSSCTRVYADRGLIPVNPEVSAYEPGQKAIIAWNGREEILILSTNVHSNGESFVVELLPLPSEPERIEPASFSSFEKIEEIIWMVGLRTYGGNGYFKIEDGVSIVFYEKIGAHNITVVKASNSQQLTNWMRDFLQSGGVSEEISLQNFKSVVEDYMARGFRYYVLDLITFSPELKSVEPILYQFNTSFLYYPLKITSPVSGDSKLTLFLFTEGVIEDTPYPFNFAGYQTSNGWKPIRIWLSNGELSVIDLRLGTLFENGAWMCVLTYDGELSTLTEDLMITQGFPTSAGSPTGSTDAPLEIIIALSVILGAACTLAGAVTTYLIMHSKQRMKCVENP